MADQRGGRSVGGTHDHRDGEPSPTARTTVDGPPEPAVAVDGAWHATSALVDVERIGDGARLPTGTAAVVGFVDADDLLAAITASTAASLEAAIAERLWRRAISDRGDAASTLLLDAARVQALLHGPDEPAPHEVVQLRARADRRAASLVRRLEATTDHGPPLARAIARWRLSDAAIRIVATLIGCELGPRLARLAAFLGGDASRPGVVVEALAAVLGVEELGVVQLARELASGAPLHDRALVLLRAPELPLVRRTLWLAPRVVDLALGRWALDEHAAAAFVAPQPRGCGPGDDARAAIRAVVTNVPRGRPAEWASLRTIDRPRDPVVGVVRDPVAGALAAIARALDDTGGRLLACELSSLADDTRLAALAREAALFDAAIALRVDVVARDASRAARAVDRLAELAPVFLVGSAGEPLPLAAGVVAIELAPATETELATAIADGFSSLLTAGEAARAAAGAPLDLSTIRRAAAAIAAQPFPDDRASAVIRALADQLAPSMRDMERALAGSGVRSLVTRPAPVLSAQLAAALDTVVARWSAARLPRRLRVLIEGRPGTGKTTLAAGIAGAIGLPAFAIDPVRAARGPDQDPALASVVAVVAAGAAVLVVENVDLLGSRRPRGLAEPPFAWGWLARIDGLVIATSRDAIANMEPALRRDLDLAFAVPFPDAAERLRLWQLALDRRGWLPDGVDLEALARELQLSAAQIERVAAIATGGAAGLRAEAERRSKLLTGLASGVEVE